MAWLTRGTLLGALAPLLWLVARAATGGLDANPIAQAENELGLAALVLLIASLACTPARRVFGWTWAVRIRRELGLLAFAYATLHVLMYGLVDQELDLTMLVADVIKRPFITAGFVALLLMLPLALTSTRAWVRRLGFRRWQQLHRLTYLAAMVAVVHFIWRVKVDVGQPLTYAWMLAALLGIRLALKIGRSRRLTPG
jgi:methionine sulfoxide reductase heme-binding subunit